MDTQRLAGRKALITGGAQGMGAAIAVHWAAQGAAVCVADLNEDGIAQVAADIRAAGGQATHFKLDVTSEEQAIAAVAHVVKEFGEINLLLNNAGVNKPTIFPDTPKENYDFIMGVNAWGAFNVMKQVSKQMIAQGLSAEYPGKIINVGSILSREAFLDVIPYSMSKHAVLGLIKGGAKALVGNNITVNGYGPGVVRTELWEQLDKDLVDIGFKEKEGQAYEDIVRDALQIKKVSYPKDIVGTASFLASDDSDYMTGQMIHIDGGWCIQ